MTNHNLFAALRAAFPDDLDRVAVETVDPDGPSLCYSWRDLDRATAMVANLLASLDLPAGARVAVVMHRREFFLAVIMVVVVFMRGVDGIAHSVASVEVPVAK